MTISAPDQNRLAVAMEVHCVSPFPLRCPQRKESIMKQGTLVYDHATDRYDIRFDLDCYYGGLHCGECFDVMVRGKWKPTRIEMAADWYLVGIRTDDLQGLRVRM